MIHLGLDDQLIVIDILVTVSSYVHADKNGNLSALSSNPVNGFDSTRL
jgi:hypothetical protein